MRRLILSVVWITVACVAVAREPKAKPSNNPVAKGLPSFAGTWEIAKVQPEGATKRAHWLLFTRDGTYAALDKNGKKLWAGTFEIDSTTTPKSWDHRSHDAKKEGKDQLGIYELDADKLKLACVSGQWKGKEWVGKPRPKAFDSRETDVTLELNRAKRSSDLAHQNHQLGGRTMIEKLPEPAADYIRTTNGNDPTGFVALFDDDAVVDDAGRIIRGREAIRDWAAGDIFAANVTLDALDASEYENGVTVTAKVDGTFDRKGLPDPLIMTFDIVFRAGKIAKLTCRLADK